MLGLFKALADNTRLRLIAILDRGEFTVQELVDILEMGQSRVSRHLKILTEAGIVRVKREGTWAYYRLDPANTLFRAQLPLLRGSFAAIAGSAADSAGLTTTLEKRRERSQAFFERHARDWDHLVRELLPTPDNQEQWLSWLPDCRLLVEIGVGTGGLLEPLAAKAHQVVGVDRSEAMLQAAREKAAISHLSNVELRLGEMDHLPLDSDSVDVVVLNMVLHHAAIPEVVIREVGRVLVERGSMVVIDLDRHQSEWVREKLADQWLGFRHDELRQWCCDAGFVVQRCERIDGSEGQYSVLQLQAVKKRITSIET